MNTPVAWRILMHAKTRTALAVVGISFAIMLMFTQLGFIGMVRVGATLIYDQLDYDLIMISRNFTDILSAGTFPRRRLYQARGVTFVDSVKPVYHNSVMWLNKDKKEHSSIFVTATNLDDHVFRNSDVEKLLPKLRLPNTFAVDRISGGPNKIYGKPKVGDMVELNGRNNQLVGLYNMGVGVVDLGAMIVSDQNYLRLFDGISLKDVNVGLIKLAAGTDLNKAILELRNTLPDDVDIYTRSAFNQQEQDYKERETSTGIIFNSGAIVAFIVGMVILFQTLSTQVAKYFSEFATLKAIGYANTYLTRLVLQLAVILCGASFFPGLGLTLLIYQTVEQETGLPMSMTITRLVFVFVSVMLMAMFASIVSVRKAYKADPADLF